MITYIIAVFGTIVLTSALLLFVLLKMRQLNYRIVLAVSLSSMLAGLLVPGIFYLLSDYSGNTPDIMQLNYVFTSTLVLYIILVLLLSITITIVIPGSTNAAVASGNKKLPVNDILDNLVQENKEPGYTTVLNADDNYLEEIYNSHLVENAQAEANCDNKVIEVENNLEKSVDSVKNIDKMGVEAFKQDITVDLSVEDCIEEAFRLKMLGDMESAILHFMYALDRNPGNELVFWIVLDICVLYKSLGQIEFAKDILSNYYNTYGYLMDYGIRDEIEKNLADIA